MIAPDTGTAPARGCCSRGLSLEIGILALLLYLAVSYACTRRRRHRRRRRRGAVAEDLEAGDISEHPAIAVYEQAGTQTAPMDCAVCLGQVEAGEKLRRLPRCAHLFHADCVHAWLQAHSTCPMCRAATNSGITPATAAQRQRRCHLAWLQDRRLPWEV